MSIPGIDKISNTSEIINPHTRWAMLLWAASGKGKTRLAGSLDKLTQKYLHKRTLYIPLEVGEGGGAVTIADMGVPMWTPETLSKLKSGLTGLKGDKEFGGVVLDGATELVSSLIKPEALKFPCRERGTGQAITRGEGVPARSDYQVMGEMLRQVCQQLLNISKDPNPDCKKHIIVTATDKTQEDDDGKLIFWGPELPGAMADAAVQMFQIAATIDIKPTVIGGKRTNVRYMVTNSDGPKALKDRFRVLPAEVRLKLDENDPDGLDLCDMWERYWVPKMKEIQK